MTQNFFSRFQEIHVLVVVALLVSIVSLGILSSALANLKKRKKELSKMHEKIQEFAGEDLMATQLDLARAYIEMDQKDLATEILQQVLKEGSVIQRKNAKELLASLA